MRIINDAHGNYIKLTFMQYDDFYEIKEIGSGGYGTVYTAKYKKYSEADIPEKVVLKKFKNIDNKIELFISEVSIHTRNINYCIDYAHTRKPRVYESDFNLTIHSLFLFGTDCNQTRQSKHSYY